MDMWDILLAVYFAVVAPAMLLTLREQIRTGHRAPVYRIAGLLACAAWPLTFPAIAMAAAARQAE